MARILVIDDDAQYRRLMCDMLESANHEIVEAEDGAEGIKLHRAQPVDLIITDIIMPRQEDLETIRILRSDQPDVKIIAVTGGNPKGKVDFLDLAKKSGARHVLRKPFRRQQLMQVVAESIATAA